MKKLSILIVLLTVISLLAVSIYAAEAATFTVTASENTVHPGDTVTVTVSVTSVEDCTTGGFMFDYNEDVFEYVDGQALVSGYTTAGISTAAGNLAGYFMGDKAQTVEGGLFEITLKVKDNAAYGDYIITGTPNLTTSTETVSCSVSTATVTVACDHTNNYTDNGDGTHTATCSACGNAVTEAHTFIDGTCSCGATEQCKHKPGEAVIENMVESTWSTVGSYDEVIYCGVCGDELGRESKEALLDPFYNNAMELSSQLTLHIIIKVNTLGFNNDMDAIKASGYYAVITRIDQNGNPVETTIPAGDWLNHTSQRMKIPFSNWSPLHMADALEVAIYNNNGEKISVELETSVRAIAMDEIQKAINAGGLEDYATMLVDMLNYGAASQTRFTYNTDDLANSTLTDEMKGYATPDTVYTAKKDNSGVAIYQSTAMELGSRVEMNLILWNDAFGVDLSQVVAEVSYYNNKGVLKQQTVSGADFLEHTPKNGRARSKMVINWLDIPDCKQDVTIVFKDLAGNEIATITESMQSAIGTYMEALPNVELYPALIKFINSAYARFS